MRENSTIARNTATTLLAKLAAVSTTAASSFSTATARSLKTLSVCDGGGIFNVVIRLTRFGGGGNDAERRQSLQQHA